MKRFIALNLLYGCLVALFSGIVLPHASQAADLLALQDVPPTISLVPVMADPNPNYNHVMGEKKVGKLISLEALSSTFTINYLPSGAGSSGDICTDWPSDVQSAFSAAVNIWASKLTSSVPIVIDACWATNLPSGVLGHSGAVNYFKDFTNAPKPGTYYQASLANSLAGRRLGTNSADIYMAFSRVYNWYFGTDGYPPASQHDFISVVAHEIGHGLGFTGSLTVSSGQGSWENGGYPIAYDQFTIDSSYQQLINTVVYPNPSTILGSALTGGGIYFNGTNATAANGGTKVKLYAPSTWSSGSSYSHLDYNTYSTTANALMVYAISSGRAIHDQGTVTMGLLKDLGWQVSTVSFMPGAPTIGIATSGNAQATVSFTPPASNGGSSITGYTITSSPGNITKTGTASPITVTGLTNGTAYTFTVKATNAIGTGPASAASNSVTPIAVTTVPGAPTIGIVSAGNTQAIVRFTAPSSNGGSAITGYMVTTNPGNMTKTGTASPMTITGLTNGTTYTFTVKATNAIGTGPASSASNIVSIDYVDGDCNGNGAIEISDALFALRITVNLDPATPTALSKGDINKDGKIDISDALYILRKVVGLI
ncbi:MAG: fibronectin type III domain-containing protein [Desulfuromonadales bacterium]|nr:fibronectin type III domain-containing protein [Desulfuromonadales bacterium]